MRIVSWTVVIGSVSAILYGGVRPLVQDMRLPEINATQAAGTMARKAADTSKSCDSAIQQATEQSDPHGEVAPGDCDEPRLANQ